MLCYVNMFLQEELFRLFRQRDADCNTVDFNPVFIGQAETSGPRVSTEHLLINAFLGVNAFGTVLTVLAKGALAGLCAGLVYKALEGKNRWLAVIAAAVVCPVVNTGIFLVGCNLFFMDTIKEWAGGTNVGVFMITGLVGLNFVFEMLVNIVLSPVVLRLIKIGKKS